MVIALLRYPTTSLLAKPFHCGHNVSVRRHRLEISPVLMAAEIGIESLEETRFGRLTLARTPTSQAGISK